MLRSARRILKPSGRMAYFVIDIAPGLSPEDFLRATYNDPDDETIQDEPTFEMLARAGFRCVEERDVSDIYLEVAERWLAAASDLEAPLREALGDQTYEERLDVRRQGFEATRDCLHRRLFYVAEPV